MIDANTDRRGFLKRFAAGAAAVSTGSRESLGINSALGEVPFAEAWRSAPAHQERWQVVQEQFLLEPDFAYLNTGGLGPSPQSVISAVDEAWRRLEMRCETGHGERDAVRTRICAFMGCSEDELAITRSATEGMNLIARGLDLHDGDEILMTTHEHPGGGLPWMGVQEDINIGIRTFEPGLGGDDTMRLLTGALTDQTRVIMVSHITCTTGLVMPVEEIADLCRRRGIVCVIDGAQAPGQIPVDLHSLGCDFYVTSGHKWLLGPKGSGFLYVKDEWLDRWSPSYIGAYSDTGFDLASGGFERLRPASASEYGTRSTPLVIGFGAAIDFLSTLGIEVVASRSAELASQLRNGIVDLPGVEILTPVQACAAMMAFRLPESGGNAWDWCNLLRREYGLRLRPVGEAGLNAVRVSTHIFNTEEEVALLVEALGVVT